MLASINKQNRFNSNILHKMPLLVYSIYKFWKRSVYVKRSVHKSYFTEIMLRKGSEVNHIPLQKIGLSTGKYNLHAVLIPGGINHKRRCSLWRQLLFYDLAHKKKKKHSDISSSSNKYSAFQYLIPKYLLSKILLLPTVCFNMVPFFPV